MKKRYIKKVAVIGSGIMGTGIACHFANIGIEVLLLDISPKDLTESEEAKGLTLESRVVKNRLVNSNLAKVKKMKPSPLYSMSFLNRIETGNINDDLHKIKKVDWIIEVVVERLDIKNELFAKIDEFRKPGTLVSSNTSGIPIHLMTKNRSEDFKAHFLGTHFFNPVRYLPLLEIIPTKFTNQEVIDFCINFGELHLGKTTILCKDTPGFVGNRIGVYTIGKVLELAHKYNLTIEEADFYTGKIFGRPKTGTFKLADLVGLDTAMVVIKGLKDSCKHDQDIQNLEDLAFVEFLLNNRFYGNKTKKGFYYKEKTKSGEINRFALDLNTLEYRPISRPRNEGTKRLKILSEQSVEAVIRDIVNGDSPSHEFIKEHLASLFSYASSRIPEISEELYAIDDAMKTGYAWKFGPFEYWDMLGLEKGMELIEHYGYSVPNWIREFKEKGNKQFYKVNEIGLEIYSTQNNKHEPKRIGDKDINLNTLRSQNTIWKNNGANIIDLKDDVICLEFKSKMNSIDQDVLQAIHKSLDIAESEGKSLVISNQGENFSVGASLPMIFMLAVEQEFDELNWAIQYFQQTMMRIRYSSIPVIVAPHNMALGGGCELSLHADMVVAHAELYMGLVEFGVGLIPGGGGSKEMTLRAAETFSKGDIELNRLQDNFMNIGMAKVSTSAHEAMALGYLKPNRDRIVYNRNKLISTAKKQAILLKEQGYLPPINNKKVKVLGKQALGAFNVGAESMMDGKYMSPHDTKIAKKLGFVMAGGSLSESTLVTEDYLLDLERQAFLELCMERKTLERIQFMLQKGKPLRN